MTEKNIILLRDTAVLRQITVCNGKSGFILYNLLYTVNC